MLGAAAASEAVVEAALFPCQRAVFPNHADGLNISLFCGLAAASEGEYEFARKNKTKTQPSFRVLRSGSQALFPQLISQSVSLFNDC